MKKYLFIGGKADGHMIEANYDYWRVPYIVRDSEMVFCENDECRPWDRTFDVETYRRIKWESDDRETFQFFALESLPNSEVMSMLLNRYQPKQDIETENKFKKYEIMLERCVEEFEKLLKNPFRFKETIEFIDKIYEFLHFKRNKN